MQQQQPTKQNHHHKIYYPSFAHGAQRVIHGLGMDGWTGYSSCARVNYGGISSVQSSVTFRSRNDFILCGWGSGRENLIWPPECNIIYWATVHKYSIKAHKGTLWRYIEVEQKCIGNNNNWASGRKLNFPYVLGTSDGGTNGYYNTGCDVRNIIPRHCPENINFSI